MNVDEFLEALKKEISEWKSHDELLDNIFSIDVESLYAKACSIVSSLNWFTDKAVFTQENVEEIADRLSIQEFAEDMDEDDLQTLKDKWGIV